MSLAPLTNGNRIPDEPRERFTSIQPFKSHFKGQASSLRLADQRIGLCMSSSLNAMVRIA